MKNRFFFKRISLRVNVLMQYVNIPTINYESIKKVLNMILVWKSNKTNML
jgi:hypothetical protein